MSNKQCMTRLQKEYKTLLLEPVPGITAHPMEKSMLEWHYVLQGPAGSEYENGVYHGKLVFPSQYPFAGPSISMCTPSGRFTPNAKLCLSMSDFHPESWNPLWTCGSILNGLLSFMLDTAVTTGSMESTTEEKARYASESLAHNCKNAAFKKLFPELVEEHARKLANPSPPPPPPAVPAAAPQAASGSAQSQPRQEAQGGQGQQQGGTWQAQARPQQGQSGDQDMMDFTMSGLRLG